MTGAAVPPPLVAVGDVIAVPEADYCYGRGDLRMRVTGVDAGSVPVGELEWIEAETDSDAVDQVRQQVNGARYELWNRQRLVQRSHSDD